MATRQPAQNPPSGHIIVPHSTTGATIKATLVQELGIANS
jgi:hypothetical protein